MRPTLKLDNHGYTPDLFCRIVSLAGSLSSAEQASLALKLGADFEISGRHVQRLTREVGADLADQRDAQVALHRCGQLPKGESPPEVAVVQADGGRIGTRQPGAGPGVHHKQFKEDKVAALIGMTSQTFTEDPQPTPPPAFREARRVQRLVRQMKAQAAPASSTEQGSDEKDEKDQQTCPAYRGKPQKQTRICLASMANSRIFGQQMAAEAQRCGFYQSPRKAFLGDGLRYNWWIQRVYFRDFEPIVDFLHVLCYLYTAAWAVADDDVTRWSQFEHWMTACWQGKVAEVIEEMTQWQAQWSRSPPEEEGLERRKVVCTSVTYLRNNQSRMDYPRYRCQGLPVTSSLVESLVGEFNARVKASNKWWDRPDRAEAILQVRAALLSEDDRLQRYFAERPGRLYRRKRKAKQANIPVRKKQSRS